MPLEKPIVLDREMTLPDLLAALLLIYPVSRMRKFLTIGVVVLFSTGFLSLAAITFSDWPEAAVSMLILGFSMPLGLLFIVKDQLVLRYQFGRLQKRKSGVFQPQKSILDNEGMTSEVEDASANHRWEFFKHFKATDRVLLLTHAHDQGHTFVTRSRFSNDADWNALREFIAEKLPEIP